MIKNKIKVLIVDDSSIFTKLIEDILCVGDIEVVGIARDAFEAGEKIIQLKPDVVTLDIQMPKMSGIEFLKILLPKYPIPVVMVSTVSDSVFDAINAGAVDFVVKPVGMDQDSIAFFSSELITKIKIASIAKLGNKPVKKHTENITKTQSINEDRVIAIGASTGGTEAIAQILTSFPKEVPGIVIVQHMPPEFTKLYAKRLDIRCAIDVKEAEDGDLILPGTALIAPGGKHMQVVKKGNKIAVYCYNDEKTNGHSPSVDVLFRSVAKEMGKSAIGVLLTGMGRDGAKGLYEMKREGAYTIAQDEKSCIIYGMPKEAISLGGVCGILPLKKIAGHIIDKLKKDV